MLSEEDEGETIYFRNSDKGEDNYLPAILQYKCSDQWGLGTVNFYNFTDDWLPAVNATGEELHEKYSDSCPPQREGLED